MITDDEFVSDVARRQQLLRRWRRPLGISLIVMGLLSMALSSYRMTTEINDHLWFLKTIANDTRPLERDRAQTAARIGYGHGIIAGVGLSGAILGGALMVGHGLYVLLGQFRKERLLVEAYRGPDAI